MKTAKILKKSVLTPGNNWITLLNSANLIKKNAVNQVNFHLYHYAGNNPVRYMDPTGLFSIDEENHTITCDYNDEKDVKAAYKEFKKNKSLEKCIIKDFNKDGALILKDRDAMGRIVSSKVLSKYTIEDFWSIICDGVSYGQIFMDESDFFSTSGMIITAFNAWFDLSDIWQAIKEGDDYKLILGCYNFTSDVIGVLGPEGTCVSVIMKYSLKLSFKMAEYELQTRKKAVSSWIYSLHDPWGYYFEEN